MISSEGCVPQPRIVIGRLVIPMKRQNKKIVPKPRVWKLKDAVDVQPKWLLMKETAQRF